MEGLTMYTIGDKELAYIAGFLDGEGCVRVATQGNYPHMEVTITNTAEEPLKFIEKIFGGGICKIDSKCIEHKDIYKWYIYGKHLTTMLEALLPYLIVKKKQALLVIEFDLLPSMDDKLRIINTLSVLNKTGK